jgi:Glycosyltransferase family 87
VINSTARTRWAAIDRRLNSPAGVRLLIAIFLGIAFVFSVLPLLRCLRGQNMIDYRAWYEAGRNVLAGNEIYFLRGSSEYDFIYPPACALFLAVASVLGQCGFILVLVAINTIAWFVSARLSAQLANGELSQPNAWLYLIPSFLVMVSVWSNYHLGQPSLVLLALMLGAFACLRAKREWCAGTLIALAAAMKAFPVVAIVYLVYRKYWKAATSLVLTLIFLLLILPAPFRGGFERAWGDLEKWSAGMLQYNAHGVGQRPGRSQTWKNQSLIGVANRLLRHIDIDDTRPPDPPAYANIAEMKFSTVNAIIIGIALALGIAFLVAMPPRHLRTPETDAIEFALLLLMMLMLTPLSYSYLFSWLMFPFAVVAQRSFNRKAIPWWALAAFAVFLLAAPFPRGAQAYGNFFFGALILFAGLTTELWRDKRNRRTINNATPSAVSS